MFDISNKDGRDALSAAIKVDVDTYAVNNYDNGHRNHLGASIIGHVCARNVWYSWRWFRSHVFNGRMQRLFQRGHLEEKRFIEYIRGIGGEIWEADPVTGKQFRVSKCDGHFGGSLDGIIRLPPRYGFGDKLFLAEFKTKGTGSGFVNLGKNGVKAEAPRHYVQMATYGAAYNLDHAIYWAVNKNDDDLVIEIVPLDKADAAQIERKAHHIITSRAPPTRIAMQETYHVCKYCDYRDICHRDNVPEKNCRTCIRSVPVADGKWFCEGYQQEIPAHVMAVGCDHWAFITDTVAAT